MASVAGDLSMVEQGNLRANMEVTGPREVRLGWKEERSVDMVEMVTQVRQTACLLALASHLVRLRVAGVL